MTYSTSERDYARADIQASAHFRLLPALLPHVEPASCAVRVTQQVHIE
jgi:hypothetical protein